MTSKDTVVRDLEGAGVHRGIGVPCLAGRGARKCVRLSEELKGLERRGVAPEQL